MSDILVYLIMSVCRTSLVLYIAVKAENPVESVWIIYSTQGRCEGENMTHDAAF